MKFLYFIFSLYSVYIWCALLQFLCVFLPFKWSLQTVKSSACAFFFLVNFFEHFDLQRSSLAEHTSLTVLVRRGKKVSGDEGEEAFWSCLQAGWEYGLHVIWSWDKTLQAALEVYDWPPSRAPSSPSHTPFNRQYVPWLNQLLRPVFFYFFFVTFSVILFYTVWNLNDILLPWKLGLVYS